MLILDDNATCANIVKEQVSRWGMVPFAAGTLREARDVIEQGARSARPIRVAILDADLPDATGCGVVQTLSRLEIPPSSIVVALSAVSSPAEIVRYDELGVAAYVMKPIKPAELQAALVAAVGLATSHATAPAMGNGRQPTSPRGLKVLVAENSPFSQKLAIGQLEHFGHTATVVANGRDAVAAFRAGRFDAILMDVQMPGMDGMEATAAIRRLEEATGGHVPIIAMTAHTFQADCHRCLEAGMDAYVTKPVRSHELGMYWPGFAAPRSRSVLRTSSAVSIMPLVTRRSIGKPPGRPLNTTAACYATCRGHFSTRRPGSSRDSRSSSTGRT